MKYEMIDVQKAQQTRLQAHRAVALTDGIGCPYYFPSAKAIPMILMPAHVRDGHRGRSGRQPRTRQCLTGLGRLTANFLLAVFTSVGIVACGGDGGSSSGGGFAGDHAGTYVGSSELTLSSPGVPTQHVSVATTIVVSADGSATITAANDSGQVGVTNGRVEGNTLIAHADSTGLFPGGVTCSGTEDANGTIAGDTIEGTVTASGACTGPGGTITFSVNGTFSVVRTSSDTGMSAARAGSSGILGTIAAELGPWVR